MLGLKGAETLNKSQLLGLLVLVVSLIGLALYGGLLFFSQWSMLALELTCFIVVAIVLGIVAWIGYTMVTTSPPTPLRETEENLEGKGNVSQQNASGSEKQGSS